MYLSLGVGRHVDEIRFSVLSAARFRARSPDVRTLLYTDRPELFQGLGADVRVVEPTVAARWSGEHGYVYRGKIEVLALVLASPGVHRAAIVDGDTYFTRPPSRLFERIRPGRTAMHVREGRPAPPEVTALRRVLAGPDVVDLDGVPWGITESETLYNSGVVGMHRDDRGLCADVLALTDQLLDQGFAEHSHIAEMLAFGAVLSRRSELVETFDVVTHYWPTAMRTPFHQHCSQVCADTSLDVQQQFERLWRVRPRPSLKDRVKFRVKRLAVRAGVEL